MLICKDKCRFEKRKGGGKYLYRDGFKICTVCVKAIKTNELRCYCCKSVFRVGAQANIYRQVRTMNCVRFDSS